VRGVAVATALAAGITGCAASGLAPRWATAVLPSGASFSLEVAADEASRARGYMYREEIGAREGMLFLFERSDYHPFWMRNVKFPLDILWLDRSLRVVHIAPDVPPCPAEGDCPSVVPSRPARYVLEFRAGTARAEGLRTGDRITLLSQPPLR
jgi:uncharacterized protein